MGNYRILITSRYAIDSYTKPLVDHIRHYGEVVCGADIFWESDADFDIVHIQWPEELFGWKAVSADDLKRLENRIVEWKTNGAKLVLTRHNELPHTPAENNLALYKILEKHCDGQIHMGNYSLEKLSYENALNVVIEHPHNIHLDLGLDSNQVRKKYEIAKGDTVYLLFGKLRNNEEEDAIVRNFLKIRRRDEILYVSHSNLVQNAKSGSIFHRIKTGLRKRYLGRNGIRLANKIYDNTEVSELFTMADVVVISRIHNLNSGILYLAYSFKKLIIAPAIGNIFEKLLKNPFFVPNDDASIAAAFEKARQLVQTDANMLNFEYVKTACDHEEIARKYDTFYKKILAITKYDEN